MDRSNVYNRTRARRRTQSASREDSHIDNRLVKLIACVSVFALAFVIKLAFPSVFEIISERVTASVDYKSALTVLGEGISGEREFTAAVGEAFTYAFLGVSEEQLQEPPSGESVTGEGGSTPVFAQTTEQTDDTVSSDQPIQADGAETESELKDAIIAAFKQSQEVYSDYNLPAGTTYEMPAIGISYAPPVTGEVTSAFGFRKHPADGDVKFHYGTDFYAPEGTSVTAFADGEVVAVGESNVLGHYLIINHGGVETKYAHCSEITVETGQAVTLGEEIALSGATGNATSPCLHFELLVDGVWVNPSYYL